MKSQPLFPFEVSIGHYSVTETLLERYEWCSNTFGRRGSTWQIKVVGHAEYSLDSASNKISYVFVHQEDATMFALRWGGVS